MIQEILQQVVETSGSKLAEVSGISLDKIPAAIETISGSVMRKAKSYVDDGNIMDLKDVFLGGDDAAKEGFMNELKADISTDLSTNLGIEASAANQLTESAIPEIIKVSKEKLLGPDGKFNLLTDGPRILSFFKSEGKEVSAGGGFGSLFGF